MRLNQLRADGMDDSKGVEIRADEGCARGALFGVNLPKHSCGILWQVAELGDVGELVD